jgi:periplasmic protein TonB
MVFSAPRLRARVEGPYDWGPSMSERQQRQRLTAALVTSAAVHATILALLLRSPAIALFTGLTEPPEAKLIPVSLVSRPGGGGGGPLPGAPSPPMGPDVRSPTAEPLPTPRPSPPPPPVPRVVERKPPPVAAPSPDSLASLRALAPPSQPRAAAAPARAAPTPSAPQAAPSAVPGDQVATLGTGSGGAGGDERGGGGTGTGDGSGGDGSDALARPAYGSNPKPPYPLAARRLGVEGVVTLDVLVRPDGSPAEVRVRSSSGSPLLDDSAVETVRSRWRFVPARRGNVPVESRVSFPIRFKLDAG